jgi:hypothetical protein
MADVDHDDGAYLVTRQQVSPATTAEGDRHVGASASMYHTGEKVYAGRPVERHDGNFEVVHP